MTDPLFDLSGKVALVTGGTSGIGTMIARGFVRRGVKTYVASRDLGRSEAMAADIAASENGTCIGLAADLGQNGAAAQLGEELKAREDQLDILVNNAGISSRGTLEAMDEEEWDRVLGTNLRSMFFLTQSLLPVLRAAASEESPARIINVGSIGGMHVPNWEAHAYGASKAAVHQITRSLAKRFRGENITVNAIAPGPFPSNLHDTTSEATQNSIKTYVPALRAGTAEDMEGLAVFLASRAGAYVNGHTIPLDGGYIGAL